MEPQMTHSDGTLHELDEAACWDHLAAASVGRIAYVDVDGPVVIPLNYTVHEGAIWMRTAAYAALAVQLVEQRVAFEVDDADHDDRTGWSVLARGRAEHVLGTEHGTRPDWTGTTPWPSGTRAMVLRLEPTTLTGRSIRRPCASVSVGAGRGPGTVQRRVVDRTLSVP